MFALFRIITLIPGRGWRIEFLKQVFSKWLPSKLSWRRHFSIFLGTETSYFQPQGGEASPASPTETEGSTRRRSGMASADVLFTLSKLPKTYGTSPF
jgi:hypothetical protein